MEKISYADRLKKWNELRGDIQAIANKTGVPMAIYDMENDDLQIREYHSHSSDWLVLVVDPKKDYLNKSDNNQKITALLNSLGLQDIIQPESKEKELQGEVDSLLKLNPQLSYTRQFYNTYFDGSGDYSKTRAQKLHDCLELGLSHLSGAQQGGAESDAEKFIFQETMRNIVRDLIAALGYNPSVDLIELKYDPFRTKDEPIKDKPNKDGM